MRCPSRRTSRLQDLPVSLVGKGSTHQEDVERTFCCLYSVHTDNIRFEWDEAKARTNVRKHGIFFEEAQTAFLDDHAIRFYDPDHSREEDRFIMLGMSFKLRVPVVCRCYKESDVVIRIISARKASQQEATRYRR